MDLLGRAAVLRHMNRETVPVGEHGNDELTAEGETLGPADRGAREQLAGLPALERHGEPAARLVAGRVGEPNEARTVSRDRREGDPDALVGQPPRLGPVLPRVRLERTALVGAQDEAFRHRRAPDGERQRRCAEPLLPHGQVGHGRQP